MFTYLGVSIIVLAMISMGITSSKFSMNYQIRFNYSLC